MLFVKDIEACPGEIAISSVISRCLNDQGNVSPNCCDEKFQELVRRLCLWRDIMVAVRALFLWNNDHIRNLITQNQKVILPIILPSLEKNAHGHWNQAVQILTLNVHKIFLDADQSTF